MQRRRLLRSLGVGVPVVAGCLSVGSGPTTDDGRHTVGDVRDPPEWLHEPGACGPAKGALELDEPVDAVPETTVTAAYDRLPEATKTVVRFAVHREGAVTCSDAGGSVLDLLVTEVHDRAVDPYRTDHGVRPRSIALDPGDRFHRITKLWAFDAVLV